MKIVKKTLLTLFFSITFATIFASTAAASCWVTCAAICRYTCEFEYGGSCSDASLEQKVQQCCSGAFANTPGINDVPCSASGPQN